MSRITKISLRVVAVFIATLLAMSPLSAQSFNKLLSKANKGNAEAQFKIGMWYYKGEVVDEDLDVALWWFKEAKKNGHKDADNKDADKMIDDIYDIILSNDYDLYWW